MNGTVRYFRDKHGYIAPDNRSADIFVHHSDLPPLISIKTGDRVSFEIGSRHNRQIAINTKLVEAAAVPTYVPVPPREEYLTNYCRAAATLNPSEVPLSFSGEAATHFRTLSASHAMEEHRNIK